MVCRTAIDQNVRAAHLDPKVARIKELRPPIEDDEEDPHNPHDGPDPVASKYPRKWR